MEGKKTNLTLVFSVIGTIVGLVSVFIAYRQYVEGKEMRQIQKQLTELQLEKAIQEKKQSKS